MFRKHVPSSFALEDRPSVIANSFAGDSGSQGHCQDHELLMKFPQPLTVISHGTPWAPMAPLHWSPEITSAGAALEGATDDSEVPLMEMPNGEIWGDEHP